MLTGKNIKLRALETADLDVLFEWENDESIWLVSGTLAPFSRLVLSQYLANAHLDIYAHKQLRFLIEIIDSGKRIGCIDLFDFDPKNKRAGVGVLIGDKTERFKGYASEALSLLESYAFEVLDLHQVYCNITVDNVASIQLFQNHKFEITGKKTDWIFNKGKWLDEYSLQLIRRCENEI